ncbi:MAG: hypothetical protein ABI679_05465 [Gemmatimonadota bacterium]
MPDQLAVHAIIPLSLLEAIRNLDTPVEDGLEELAGEMVSKRLGLSPTVAAQIARYAEAARKDARVPMDEALSVFRLVDRRPDAGLIFADGGRRAARHGLKGGKFPVGNLVASTPGFVGRAVGIRRASNAARRILGAELTMHGVVAAAKVESPLSAEVARSGKGCAFYGAALGELLRYQIGFEGVMNHERCRSRGDTVCEWRGTHTGGYE